MFPYWIVFIILLLSQTVYFVDKIKLNVDSDNDISGGSEMFRYNNNKVNNHRGAKYTKPSVENTARLLCRSIRNVDTQSKYIELYTNARNSGVQPPIITFDQIQHSLSYDDKAQLLKPATHIGQRKLFLTEIQFLTNTLSFNEPATVIYAGAAPSCHTGFLASLFPHVKFLLVDPNPFNIIDATPTILPLPKDRRPTVADMEDLLGQVAAGPVGIYIINDLFTMEISHAASTKIPECLFISDIRTNLVKGDFYPGTVDILWNLAQQYNWIRAMKPKRSMLKFRHPFYNEDLNLLLSRCKEQPYAKEFEMAAENNGIDFIENLKNKELHYFNGPIYLQAFPGISSTESRLVTDGSVTNHGGIQNYEDRYNYYNAIARNHQLHFNDNANPRLGFDYCNDCSIENHLWKSYAEKFKPDLNVQEYVSKLSKNTYRSLIRDGHGLFQNLYTLQSLQRCANIYASGGPDDFQFAKSLQCERGAVDCTKVGGNTSSNGSDLWDFLNENS